MIDFHPGIIFLATMKIKELCETERPREKMLIKGAAALSEAELLAVLLRSGTRECGAVDLANKLLKAKQTNVLGTRLRMPLATRKSRSTFVR